MAHTKTTWCVQSEDCQRLWVIKSRPKKQIVITFKPPVGNLTKFISYLPDPRTGEDTLVGIFPNKWKKDRFENTTKYQKAFDGEYWEFKD